ncbi:MAG: cell division protein FtsK [Deltaproteobacteria bacterium]|nr:MAG: cell division protein FtsK [Deltaproteobacteria bacterium]
MHKEIIGILLVLSVILTGVSLLTFHGSDPSIHHLTVSGDIENRFGLIGSHIAGMLIGLFGLGAFWLPVLLAIGSWHFLKNRPTQPLYWLPVGGTLLVIATGSLLAFQQDTVLLMGERFPSGGMIGALIKSLLASYAQVTGGQIFLVTLLIIGLVLVTGITVSQVFRFIHLKVDQLGGLVIRAVQTVWTWIRQSLFRRREQKANTSRRLPKAEKKPKPEQKKNETGKTAPALVPGPPPARPALVKKKSTPDPQVLLKGSDGYVPPPESLLSMVQNTASKVDADTLSSQSRILEEKLSDFGVNGAVTAVNPGPVITTFEYEPAPGVKITKVVNLADDLALALSALSIRIIAPIPGRSVIGIEIPNIEREMVGFREIVTSNAFKRCKSHLTLCLGKDIIGAPVAVEMDKMPHLLIAGATGAGKSVGLNVMIASLLFKSTPDQVKMIMIDPKRIELSVYDGIPHLITPVVTDMKKATNALFWAVREMERRYELLASVKARNILQYNKKVGQLPLFPEASESPQPDPLPYIVIIIDEFADLMMVSSKDVEVALTRLAQMARAAGIHLILATQRPSVNVLTGIIKANFPTRIGYQVSSKIDSRTILDTNGAESLLGNGDMLFLPPGTSRLMRIQGAYISDDDLQAVIEFLKAQKPPEYDDSVTQAGEESNSSQPGSSDEDHDAKYDEAVAFVARSRQASISSVQRHLRIGYNRAARIIETMEREGVIGPQEGSSPREVLVADLDERP